MRKQPTGLSKEVSLRYGFEVRGVVGGVGGVRLSRPRTSYLTLLSQDFVEICKREGGDPEEKGVDRLLGLGSARLG